MADKIVFGQQVTIKFYVNLIKSPNQIKTDLTAVYGEWAFKETIISRWINGFQCRAFNC